MEENIEAGAADPAEAVNAVETAAEGQATASEARPAGAEQAETKTGEAERAEAEKPEDAPAQAVAKPARKTLLEEADEPEEPAGDAGGTDGAGKDEALAKFTGSIRALDLGDGVTFDDAAFRAIAPELMELSGGDPKRAEPLVRRYVQGEIARARAEQEAQDAFNEELRNQCRARWGADLRSVAKAAGQGGRIVFGDKIWNEMKGIESFANNPDIMERLAIVGRRFAEDGGAVHPAGQEPEDTRDVIARMYGGIK